MRFISLFFRLLFLVSLLLVVVIYGWVEIWLPHEFSDAKILQPAWLEDLRVKTFAFSLTLGFFYIVQAVRRQARNTTVKILVILPTLGATLSCCFLGIVLSVNPDLDIDEVTTQNGTFKLILDTSDSWVGSYQLYECKDYGIVCYQRCETGETWAPPNANVKLQLNSNSIAVVGFDILGGYSPQPCEYIFNEEENSDS